VSEAQPRWARIVSVLFHPLFMPFASMALAFWLDEGIGYFTPKELVIYNFIMVFCMTVLFPLISILILLRGKVISSIKIPLREERILPYFMSLFYYGLTYFLLQKFPYDLPILSMMLGALISLGLCLLITTKWKISAHMIGLAGLVATLAGLMALGGTIPIVALILSVIVLGVVASARLALHSHTQMQVYAGIVVGFVPVFICVLWGLRI